MFPVTLKKKKDYYASWKSSENVLRGEKKEQVV